jgi:hypothetical protein
MGIAENISNLVGEFDRPNLENVEKAVKFYLAMGFGAEARMLLDAFQDVRGDASVWRAMSHIVDLEPVRGPAFDGMQTCDTGAAMWAAMANDELPPLQQVAIPAVLRTFSALPLHLRRHLGPGLASRFLSRGDQTSARAISDAIARAPSEPDASFKLLEATIDLASGDQASAETILKPLSGSSGAVGLQSTVSLIETQITAGEEISQELTTTAEALLHEARGGQSEAALERALSLAYASQNRFSDAFTLLDKAAKESTPIWELLAKQGSDTEVLAHAIFENSQKTPAVTHEMGTKFARRLLDLGFPDQAMLWLSDILEKESTAGPVGLLLAAEIESAREDTAAALSFLDLLDEDESKDLRAKILATMDGEGAVEQLASLGQIEAAAQSAKRQENWSQMGAFIEGGVWQEAAGLVTGKSVAGAEPEVAGQPVADGGAAADTPLLNSRLALKESAAARAVLERLLATETGPSPEN